MTKEKKDIIDLQKYIPPINHDQYKNLRIQFDVTIHPNVSDEEDIIYVDNNNNYYEI